MAPERDGERDYVYKKEDGTEVHVIHHHVDPGIVTGHGSPSGRDLVVPGGGGYVGTTVPVVDGAPPTEQVTETATTPDTPEEPTHPPILVVDGDGRAVGVAIWDSAAGVYVDTSEETTVVEEYATASDAIIVPAWPGISSAPDGPADVGNGMLSEPGGPYMKSRSDWWRGILVPRADGDGYGTRCIDFGLRYRTLTGDRRARFRMRLSVAGRDIYEDPVDLDVALERIVRVMDGAMSTFYQDMTFIWAALAAGVPPFPGFPVFPAAAAGVAGLDVLPEKWVGAITRPVFMALVNADLRVQSPDLAIEAGAC